MTQSECCLMIQRNLLNSYMTKFCSCTQKCNVTVILVPEFCFVSSQLSKTRSEVLPQLPQYVDDLIIQEAWRKTWCGKRFLLHQDNDCLLVFTTKESIKVLIECSQIYMDVTFRPTPKPYNQMFIALVDYNERMVPLITALMTNHAIGNYGKVFQRAKHSVRRITQ